MAVWRRWVTGLLLLAAMLAGHGAWAQGRPRIEAFDVERVAALTAGTRLNFSVFGSPGGQVALQIDGLRRPVPLREVQPGVYDGSHVLEAGEPIAADARVVATLQLGGQASSAVLDEPLVLGERPLAGPPRVDTPPPHAEPPARAANPAWPPAPSSTPAPAGTPPRPAPMATPSAEPSPQPTPQPTPEPAPRLPGRVEAPPCADCAVVESIRPLAADTRAPASAAGSLFGSLFGERVGSAVDRHVARVTGAVERAVHGRPLDEASAGGVEVVLRLPNGQRLLRTYDRVPDLRVGDTVRRSSDLGGARSERLLDGTPAPRRRPSPRSDQFAESPAP